MFVEHGVFRCNDVLSFSCFSLRDWSVNMDFWEHGYDDFVEK